MVCRQRGGAGKIASPPNSAQILAAGQLSLGAPFQEQDLGKSVESIKRLLKSNGLYEAEVSSSVEHRQEAQVAFITFTVKEHKRAKYEMPAIHGATGLSDATILRVTGWRIPIIHWWRQVTEARTSGGVERVLKKYAAQDRLTAAADIDKLDYDAGANRVRPTLNVNPGPKVEVTSVEAKIPKRVIKRYVPVFEESAVADDLLMEGKRNLQDYLESQGYYDATVNYRMGPPENDTVKIEYIIARGSRYKLARLTIRGNQYFSSSVIRERMFMQPSAFTLRRGRYSDVFRRKDEENITDLYQANGFRDVKVNAALDKDYKGKPSEVAVNVTITEGAQWLVNSLEIEGVDEQVRNDLLPSLVSTAGEPFAAANIAHDRVYVLNYYASRGFPGAEFQSRMTPADKPHRVNVMYTIKAGERQYIRHLVISGLRTTRRALVERTLGIQDGDPLSPNAQLRAQQRLYDLKVFSRVDTAIENPEGETDHKYLLYSFDEASRYRLTLGLGAQVANFGTPNTTTLANPGGTTGFSPQFSVDLSRLDFLGLGHTITLRGGYSSIEKRASLTYVEPRLHDIPNLDITYTLLFDESLNVRTFASRREEASVQAAYKFSKTLTGILRYAYRQVSVSNIVIPVLLVPQLDQGVRISLDDLRQHRAGSPRQPGRPSPRHVYHRRGWCCGKFPGFAAQLRAGAGA